MSPDPMIGGKSREEWSVEEARILATRKPDSSGLKFAIGYTALLIGAGLMGHNVHEAIMPLLMGWIAYGAYCARRMGK